MFGRMGREWTDRAERILPRSKQWSWLLPQRVAVADKEGKKREEGMGDDSGEVMECLEEERRGSRRRNLDAGRRWEDKFKPQQAKQVI